MHYGAFMADPFRTIRSIYERLGAELTPDAEARMRQFLDENRADKHGSHEYSFADTGLDAGAVRDRARRYAEYFDVQFEPPGSRRRLPSAQLAQQPEPAHGPGPCHR